MKFIGGKSDVDVSSSEMSDDMRRRSYMDRSCGNDSNVEIPRRRNSRSERSNKSRSDGKNDDVSLSVSIHHRSSRGVTIDVEDLTPGSDIESSRSIQEPCNGRKGKFVQKIVTSEVLGPTIGDALVDTMECASALINFVTRGQSECEDESGNDSSSECSKLWRPGDVAMQQMRMILSPRTDEVILDVINACRYCCRKNCGGNKYGGREAKRKQKRVKRRRDKGDGRREEEEEGANERKRTEEEERKRNEEEKRQGEERKLEEEKERRLEEEEERKKVQRMALEEEMVKRIMEDDEKERERMKLQEEERKRKKMEEEELERQIKILEEEEERINKTMEVEVKEEKQIKLEEGEENKTETLEEEQGMETKKSEEEKEMERAKGEEGEQNRKNWEEEREMERRKWEEEEERKRKRWEEEQEEEIKKWKEKREDQKGEKMEEERKASISKETEIEEGELEIGTQDKFAEKSTQCNFLDNEGSDVVSYDSVEDEKFIVEHTLIKTAGKVGPLKSENDYLLISMDSFEVEDLSMSLGSQDNVHSCDKPTYKLSLGNPRVTTSEEDCNPSIPDRKHSVHRSDDSLGFSKDDTFITDETELKSHIFSEEETSSITADGSTYQNISVGDEDSDFVKSKTIEKSLKGDRKSSDESRGKPKVKSTCFDPNCAITVESVGEIEKLIARDRYFIEEKANEVNHSENQIDRDERGSSSNDERSSINREGDETPDTTGSKTTMADKGVGTAPIERSPFKEPYTNIYQGKGDPNHRPAAYGCSRKSSKSNSVGIKVNETVLGKSLQEGNLTKVENRRTHPEQSCKVIERMVDEITVKKEERVPESQQGTPTVIRRKEIKEIGPNNSIVFEKTVTEIKRSSRYPEKMPTSVGPVEEIDRRCSAVFEKTKRKIKPSPTSPKDRPPFVEGKVNRVEISPSNTKKDYTKFRVNGSVNVNKVSVGCGTSRIDLTATSVNMNKISVGCVTPHIDLAARSVKVNKNPVGCEMSKTGVTETPAKGRVVAETRKHKKERRLRFVSGKEDYVLGARDFKTMKIKTKAVGKTCRDEGLGIFPRRRRKKMMDVTMVGRTWDITTGEKMPLNHSTSSLRFHIHDSDGSVVEVREVDLQPSRKHSGSSEDEVDIFVEAKKVTVTGVGEPGVCHHRSTSDPYHADSCPTRTASSLMRSQARFIHNRIKCSRKSREKARTLWAVARINEFGEGGRTMEIISTDDKKPPSLKQHAHEEGKYSNEVYVVVPPNKSPTSY